MICIDPGVKACGVAFFDDDGRLTMAQYVQKVDLGLVLSNAGRALIIEMPRYYPGRQKGDVNDLLDLAAVVGYCERICHPYSKRVYPAAWKGQVPKPVMSKRILSCLSPDELANIQTAGSKTHNIVDAIGIGLWHFNRLQGAK